jgi:hypothetical protein
MKSLKLFVRKELFFRKISPPVLRTSPKMPKAWNFEGSGSSPKSNIYRKNPKYVVVDALVCPTAQRSMGYGMYSGQVASGNPFKKNGSAHPVVCFINAFNSGEKMVSLKNCSILKMCIVLLAYTITWLISNAGDEGMNPKMNVPSQARKLFQPDAGSLSEYSDGLSSEEVLRRDGARSQKTCSLLFTWRVRMLLSDFF